MKILQILPELNIGGVETGVLDLSRELTKLGHKIVVVSAGGVLVDKLISYGVTHYNLPVHKKSLFTMLKSYYKLVDIIIKEDIEIVHARSRVPAWIAYFASRKTKRVFITTCHGYYNRGFFSYVMGWGKRVIVLSKAISRHMVEDFSVPKERIRLIPRAVDLEKFRYVSPLEKRRKKEEFIVGIIGRITPLKGHLYFIQAMAEVVRFIPNLKIFIVGSASNSKQDYLEKIHYLIAKLGLKSRTVFFGSVLDVSEVLSQLDCLVLSTITEEGFGRVIIEAQAAGVPVVATRVGGIIDIIEDNKTGILVSPCQPAEIVSAVMKIYQSPEFAEKLAISAYERVKEKYNLENFVKKKLEVYKEALEEKKILLIKISALGDVVLVTPTIKAIKKYFPRYKLSVLVGKEEKRILVNSPYIDELIVVDFKGKDRNLFRFFKLSRLLKRKDFDFLIDLQNSLRTHILGFLSGIKDRYGFNRNFGFLLNHPVPYGSMDKGPLEHQLRVLKLLGIEDNLETLELWPSKEDEDYIENFLNTFRLTSDEMLVGINISASLQWKTKVWPKEYIIKLCEELVKKNLRPVLTGTKEDIDFAVVLEKINPMIINACGKTSINQLACLIRHCAVYVSADSAPLHIAVAVGTPYVALFGPTDPQRHLVVDRKSILLYKRLPCSPCYKKTCKNQDCMQQITVEEVLSAIAKILALPEKLKNESSDSG